VYSSGNTDVRNWVYLFESRCIIPLACNWIGRMPDQSLSTKACTWCSLYVSWLVNFSPRH